MWIGVITGLYVVVVCTTGAALVFRIDIQRALYPTLFTPMTAGPLAHPAEIMDSVKRAFPDDRVSGVDAPTTGRPTYLAYSSRGTRFRTLMLDPASATVLGELNDASFVRTLQNLHFDLLSGRTGRVVNGIGAMLLLTMCLTGVVIWWPGRIVGINVSRPWRRVNWELHGAIGFWSALAIAMWAATGLSFTFPGAFRSTVDRISPITVARTPQSGPRGQGSAPTWRALIDRARQHVPAGLHVARVVTPSNDTAPFLVMFSSMSPTPLGARLSSVYLDQHTGALLASPLPAAPSIGDTIMAWVVPLHVGAFDAGALRMLWVLFGLAPPLLFITGFTMWWTRVVRPRWRRVQRGAVISASSDA